MLCVLSLWLEEYLHRKLHDAIAGHGAVQATVFAHAAAQPRIAGERRAADILERVQTGRRRMAGQAARFGTRPKPFFHRCIVCGITDRSHPDMDFRYCSKCIGACGYCTDHLHNHEHVLEAGRAADGG